MADERASDLELLRAWRHGDAGAGNALCRRYQVGVRRLFAAKVADQDVEELVQQTWLALTRARERIDESEVPIRSFRAYLFGVARHVLVAHYRRRARAVAFDPEVDTLGSVEPSLSRQLSQQRHAAWVQVALHSLPLDLQLLAEGRYVEDLSSPELAEAFGIPEGTVRSRLHRARRLLGEAMRRLPGADREP
jgi:RNA polymerase sigma factor (sigma-70 family)